MKLGVTATKQELCSFVLQLWSNQLCLNDIEHSSTDLDTFVYIYIYIYVFLNFFHCNNSNINSIFWLLADQLATVHPNSSPTSHDLNVIGTVSGYERATFQSGKLIFQSKTI